MYYSAAVALVSCFSEPQLTFPFRKIERTGTGLPPSKFSWLYSNYMIGHNHRRLLWAQPNTFWLQIVLHSVRIRPIALSKMFSKGLFYFRVSDCPEVETETARLNGLDRFAATLSSLAGSEWSARIANWPKSARLMSGAKRSWAKLSIPFKRPLAFGHKNGFCGTF